MNPQTDLLLRELDSLGYSATYAALLISLDFFIKMNDTPKACDLLRAWQDTLELHQAKDVVFDEWQPHS